MAFETFAHRALLRQTPSSAPSPHDTASEMITPRLSQLAFIRIWLRHNQSAAYTDIASRRVEHVRLLSSESVFRTAPR